MNILNSYIGRMIFLVLATFIFSACGKTETATQLPSLSPITSDDSCHVCGMTISGFPGPKAQAFIKHQDSALKFCSTSDLFNWLLQPDTPAILREAFVHDMAASAWDTPNDNHYVNARQAWYVSNHDQSGAMGPTLASFKDKLAAEVYIKEHGGELKQYADISLEFLSRLKIVDSHKQHGMQDRK